MHFTLKAAGFLLGAALGPQGLSLAQPHPTQPAPSLHSVHPSTDPATAVPLVIYRSPLSTYRTYTEPELGSWPHANELVNQRGGWRAYAREARPPINEPGAPVKPVEPAGAAGHSRH